MYLQIDGLAIGASLSVFLADLYMIKLERLAMESFAHPPELWFWYVDDTSTSLLEEYIKLFQTNLNQQNPILNFKVEQEQNLELPFQDTVQKVEADGSMSNRIYRKETPTYQYLNFGSNHHISQKV